MGKVRIYMKVIDGVINYRDSESNYGTSITTLVKPGDTVIWERDRNSGISKIEEVSVEGQESFFDKKPKKGFLTSWKASVRQDATGQVTYKPYVKDNTAVKAEFKSTGETAKQLNDPDGPVIRVKP